MTIWSITSPSHTSLYIQCDNPKRLYNEINELPEDYTDFKITVISE